MRAEQLQSAEALRIAAEIVDSAPVITAYASSEWAELSDDGKEWIAAIVAETRRRFAPAPTEPGKVCHGNVRPAPFAMTPGTVAATLGHAAGGRIERVPVVPVTLVDRPRRSEDPRLAKANDA